MQTIDQIQDEIIEEFEFYDNWMDKYEHIIQFGKELEGLPEESKIDDNLVRGCQSRVWLEAKMKEDKLVFSADSDAIITKGLAGLVIKILSDQSPSDIVKAELYFADRIGLNQHLSQNRSNGLASMVKKIKMYAIAFQAK